MMKDSRSLLLIILSILLLAVSLALLWTWGYNYGKQNNKPVFVAKDTIVATAPSGDSIQSMYANAAADINQLKEKLLRADSVNYDLAGKLMEFYKLKEEIAGLLKNNNGKQDLSGAQGKISQLQLKLDDLNDQNKSIIRENKRLSALVSQLMAYQKPEKKDDIVIPKVAPKKTDTPENTPSDSAKPAEQPKVEIAPAGSSVFAVSNIHISGLIETEDGNRESDAADQISKLTGSFSFRNNFSARPSGEVMVVIQRPDGKVLKPASWEAGTFETKEGFRVYSSKIRFECNKGESKQLDFSVAADEYPKGNYTIEIFQNGIALARTSKTLN